MRKHENGDKDNKQPLYCTLISENEGLFQIYGINFEKTSGDKLKKNSGVQELKFF